MLITPSIPSRGLDSPTQTPNIFNMYTTALVMLVLLLHLATAEHWLESSSRGISPELAVGCKQLRLPSNLCSSCPLKPFDSDGEFAQRLDAFELSGKSCQKALKKYVKLNPCDTVRAKQIANQKNKHNARGLEIFMYAVCETCCDCIPIGAKLKEYEQRKKAKTLLTPLRGNCVMHYLFDTCKLLPDVADVVRPGLKFLGDKKPKKPVCEIISDWRGRGFGRDWQLDPKVEKLPKDVRKYLRRMTRFMGCKKRNIWKSCVLMEQARGRV